MDEVDWRRRRANFRGGGGDRSPVEGLSSSGGDGYDTLWLWESVIPLLEEARDREAVSTVCKSWYEIDRLTRKHVTMALCYTATPEMLSSRFPNLESLKLKGKPRAAMFNLIPEDWGGYVTPWLQEIARSYRRMKALHFRRMIVTDSDLELLASSNGKILQVLKLDKCSGFSTDGLRHIARSCRNLRSLILEESAIVENDGEWLHELAENNTVLENLNFYMTEFVKIDPRDLDLIARRCPSLVSVKIHDCDLRDLIGFFRSAASLEEFGGGSFSEPLLLYNPGEEEPPPPHNAQLERYASVVFPPKLCRLGLTYLGNDEMPIVYPIAAKLKKLDLFYALLDTESHCRLLQRCPNLEVLEVRNVIGDRGLENLGQFCKKIKRLRIERAADENDMEDVEGIVTQRGLVAVAKGCPLLEYFAVYVSDITNESLACIGRHCKSLDDFRLVLLDREEKITDLPLDEGVRSLLMNCRKLERFALYLRPGGLTDVGLGYVGRYSPKVKWMLLGYVGESDRGLMEFSKGCPSLQKLEMRGCCFSEGALAAAAMELKSMRYLWVQGYRRAKEGGGRGLSAMVRPYWNIELIPAKWERVDGGGLVEHPAHILAYYSLAGRRTDFPPTVRPFEII
ncbi:coronatine-insensitive 1 [Genlisea aurea]|uniref:Coronatine-insensitive 1 n=1 Tax=Genlisea aurea TaxID=192259 RepID=S8D1K8_9LAMI|nr:coronatine-insensitive 1 [Genlisea aurea]